jgi:hypothetical protein
VRSVNSELSLSVQLISRLFHRHGATRRTADPLCYVSLHYVDDGALAGGSDGFRLLRQMGGKNGLRIHAVGNIHIKWRKEWEG